MSTHCDYASSYLIMTVLETTQLTSEQIKALTDEQKKDLPTIIEVLEYLSSIENANMRDNLRGGMRDLFVQGKYAVMSDQAWTNIPKLYPCSQTTFTLMRGESSYHADSHPSLYRPQTTMTEEDYLLISRLRACEFIAIMKRHRVVRELARFCKIEYMAIAQHYGFATEFMDVTNQKWVAAFFASTKYENGNYLPFDPGDEHKIGVVYVGEPLGSETYPANIRAMGFHYFERPTRQNALVYEMTENDNFDAIPFFKRIVFRHDAAASEFVFKMCYDHLRYFPKDNWADIAEQIRKADNPISQAAIDECRNYGVTHTDNEIKDVLLRNHILYATSDTPQAMPNQLQMDEDYRIWNTYLLPHLARNILRLPTLYRIP